VDPLALWTTAVGCSQAPTLAGVTRGRWAQDPPWPPDLTRCEKDTETQPLGDAARLIVRTWLDADGRVVAFNLIHQVNDSRWKTVCRICTAHGTLHVHRYRRDGGESIEKREPLTSVYDVMRVYKRAHGEVFAELENNIRRWRGGA
jgi:hypothetical protein